MLIGLIFSLVVVLASIPIGYLLAGFCKEEIISGKKYFLMAHNFFLIIAFLSSLYYLYTLFVQKIINDANALAVMYSAFFIYGLHLGAIKYSSKLKDGKKKNRK